MLVGAPTGSGKTASYLLPLLNFAAQSKHVAKSEGHQIFPHSIILSTTQELLGQIWTDAVRLGQNSFPKNGKIAILRKNHYQLRKNKKDSDEKKAKKLREMRLPNETRILITTPKRLATLIASTGAKCPINFQRSVCSDPL